jgi:hypothetical protein
MEGLNIACMKVPVVSYGKSSMLNILASATTLAGNCASENEEDIKSIICLR